MDWLAGIFELCGRWFVGDKNRWGFILQMLGSICWLFSAIKFKMYGLLVVVIPVFLVSMRNFIKWTKEKKR